MADADVATALEIQDLCRMDFHWRTDCVPIPADKRALVDEIRALRRGPSLLATMSCCGFKEISGIGGWTLEEVIDRICTVDKPGDTCAYYLFTQATAPPRFEEGVGYGYNLSRFITDNGLGSVHIAAGPEINPNSNNLVVMFAWKPDTDAVYNWFVKRHPFLGPALYGANLI